MAKRSWAGHITGCPNTDPLINLTRKSGNTGSKSFPIKRLCGISTTPAHVHSDAQGALTKAELQTELSYVLQELSSIGKKIQQSCCDEMRSIATSLRQEMRHRLPTTQDTFDGQDEIDYSAITQEVAQLIDELDNKHGSSSSPVENGTFCGDDTSEVFKSEGNFPVLMGSHRTTQTVIPKSKVIESFPIDSSLGLRSTSDASCTTQMEIPESKKIKSFPFDSFGLCSHADASQSEQTSDSADHQHVYCGFTFDIRRTVQSSTFNSAVGLVIFLNAIIVGFQTNWMATNLTEDLPWMFIVSDIAFLLLFSTELGLRLYVYRMQFFFDRNWKWNCFDAFVVGVQWLEELLKILVVLMGGNMDLDVKIPRLLTIVRILRLFKFLRVVRMLHLVSELRTIVSSILSSMSSLLWTMVLILLILYLVGVGFTQSVTDHRVAHKNDDPTANMILLSENFGSLSLTMVSLWQSMSGGIDWKNLMDPLTNDIHPLLGMSLAVFMAFAVLALLNVVTGAFVQMALQRARVDEDRFLTDQIMKLFEAYKQKSEGRVMLNVEDLENVLEDPLVANEWRAIDVQPEEAKHLFDLLDANQDGKVAFDEFLAGCLRLRGFAKSIDLLTMMQEFRTFKSRFEKTTLCQASEMHLETVSMDLLTMMQELRAFTSRFETAPGDAPEMHLEIV